MAVLEKLHHPEKYWKILLKWGLLGILMGGIGGLLGAWVHHALHFVTHVRGEHPWLILLLPLGQAAAVVGVLLMGLGCAPIYPCIIHSTPAHFGAENSQALVGVQMASAYMGNILMPPLFGVIANHVSIRLFPW